jgi:hypothetical protein
LKERLLSLSHAGSSLSANRGIRAATIESIVESLKKSKYCSNKGLNPISHNDCGRKALLEKFTKALQAHAWAFKALTRLFVKRRSLIMPVRLTNKDTQLMIVPLRSGITLHLAPSETSQPIDELETNANDKVGKLVRLGLLEIAPVESSTVAATAPPPAKKNKSGK